MKKEHYAHIVKHFNLVDKSNHQCFGGPYTAVVIAPIKVQSLAITRFTHPQRYHIVAGAEPIFGPFEKLQTASFVLRYAIDTEMLFI